MRSGKLTLGPVWFYDPHMAEATDTLRYVSDEHGRVTAVLVPIKVWKGLSSEVETRHLLRSERMRRRLEEAMRSADSIGFDEALVRLGVSEDELQEKEQR